MMLAAAHALAGLVTESQLSAQYILPYALDPHVAASIAHAVASTAFRTGQSKL
jgi:malate dehydrogenase (oxaloacetate-decarboxylating)